MKKEVVKGYKVFNADWTCRGFKYVVGETFEEDVIPSCCNKGFHFCTKAADCFNYYRFNPDNKVAEVEAIGKIDTNPVDSKCCTNKIRIVRELSWDEVLEIVNIGKGCTGLRNSGDHNSGHRNSGNYNSCNYNSGDWNSGDYNSGNLNSGNRNSGNNNKGNWNSGDSNSGNYNSGDWNSGNRNSGNGNSGNRNNGYYNSGDYNSGNYNSSHWNSGNHNSGNWNSGKYNSGNRNSGNYNSGNRNSGNYNSGNRNSGDYNNGNWNSGNWNNGKHNSGDSNSGNWNSGDWNKTDFSSGCFNTKEQNILMFNKASEWTLNDWWDSEARKLLNQIQYNVLEWIRLEDMTDEEKKLHPECKTTGGYLKELDKSECNQIWWDSLSDMERNIIRNIPNFDEAIFEEITGIKIERED